VILRDSIRVGIRLLQYTTGPRSDVARESYSSGIHSFITNSLRLASPQGGSFL